MGDRAELDAPGTAGGGSGSSPAASAVGPAAPFAAPARATARRLLAAADVDPGVRLLAKLILDRGVSGVVSGAHGGSASVALAASLRHAAVEGAPRPVLILTRTDERARSSTQDLAFLLGDDGVFRLPEVDTGEYTTGMAGMSVRAQRLEVLADLAGRLHAAPIVVASVEAASLRVPHPDHLRGHLFRIRVGDEIDMQDALIALDDLGYRHVPMVEEHGDYSRRGGILDFFSFGRDHPVRVEFDGDDIASIREFDVGTQRSVARLDTVTALPTHELRFRVSELEDMREDLEARHPKGADGADVLIDDMINRRDLPGAFWLAGFFPSRLGDLFEYLPSETLVVLDAPHSMFDHLTGYETDTRTAFEDARARSHTFAPPDDTFLFGDAMKTRVAGFDRLILPGPTDPPAERMGATMVDVALNTRPSEGFGRNMNLLRDSLKAHTDAGHQVIVVSESESHADRLRDILDDTPITITVGNIGEGFTFVDEKLVVITDHEIWGRPRRRRERRRRFKRGVLPDELQSLKPGDYVVHVEHGIGVYQGLERLELKGHLTDCLLITYTKGDKLYVPADQLDLIQRYSAGEGAKPSVSTIGGTGWSKLKSRVKKRIKMMAEELIQTYAKRRARPGHAFSPDTDWQREMEAAFPYDETPDQLNAIEEVKKDMGSTRPMDRLVCGDVGFGKTEVALRAAFKAVSDGKQVAMLVPTTLLAEQHFATFSERMKPYPFRVEMMSRFRTTAKNKKTAEEVSEGKVDVLIGTHRLLSKDVNFKDLGLVIVDEEQRFGVRHKEILKKLTTQVDCVTLTATPIPRTLHMSLMGARDMSVINTPPRERQPIHTEIVQFSDEIIMEALLREADLGGQSFFVHNRVETINAMGAYLAKLVPELRIGIAHGQMPERQIERVMIDFHAREYDVLLSTMIIESGLDIPSVNTILINRADAFGLAQLYQLRGRVGRSSRKAFAYLLVPRDRVITETAQKRLKVIDELDALGSGFQLAMRDLEIRGAGNMLGGEQSGFIVNVGFDMYCRLLEEAVHELKGLPIESKAEVKVSTDVDAYLPDEFVPERSEKVRLYKRLADTESVGEVDEIENELRDRFGSLPEPGWHLLNLRRLRLLATDMGAVSVILRKGLFEVRFRTEMTRDQVRGLLKATSAPVEFSSTGDHGFRISRFPEGSPAEAIRLMEAVRGVSAPETVDSPQ